MFVHTVWLRALPTDSANEATLKNMGQLILHSPIWTPDITKTKQSTKKLCAYIMGYAIYSVVSIEHGQFSSKSSQYKHHVVYWTAL